MNGLEASLRWLSLNMFWAGPVKGGLIACVAFPAHFSVVLNHVGVHNVIQQHTEMKSKSNII